nr:hypothetical protein [Tanacetum cinerariifolium]
MMNKFLDSVGLDRESDFTSLEMTASKTSSDPISIVFKKRTLYEVAIHDGYQLKEIGLKDDGLRHFKDASFTEFGESYPQMWPHSAGILAFMIAEAGRVFSSRQVLSTLMCVDLSITLDNEYQWLAEIPHKWWLFCKWDRELKAMGVNQRDETKVAISTNKQFRELTDRIKDVKDASHAPLKKIGEPVSHLPDMVIKYDLEDEIDLKSANKEGKILSAEKPFNLCPFSMECSNPSIITGRTAAKMAKTCFAAFAATPTSFVKTQMKYKKEIELLEDSLALPGLPSYLSK